MNYKEEDKKHIAGLARKYLEIKIRHKANWGQKNRIFIRREYEQLVEELYYRLPDNYEIDGYVLVKGHNPKLNKIYLQLFTKESFARMKGVSQSEPLKT